MMADILKPAKHAAAEMLSILKPDLNGFVCLHFVQKPSYCEVHISYNLVLNDYLNGW